ncbi:hypothetical protein HBI56_060800 [Parastagonospora nodorum]|nr:hypothetical protein HBH56_157790 [Parastagonospora nodorum]KAH3922920.1 hypothetical protein HBH54_216950 [Parastagonospora nodorum]KAH3946834.1 hypothetical protein HBH53_124110 [Parastagonospora nodorum]KAH3973518.1 hypothetical protein HBH51_097320 [Parastagonospora nodorum]KAH4002664.1 hypothetical protein HBI10_073660 [Parastagonospora nodorum]
MCTEILHRPRTCQHTSFLRWDYCSVIIPSDREPEVGRACRLYKVKYKRSHDGHNCFECARENIMRNTEEKDKNVKNRRMRKIAVRLGWVFGRK